MWLRICQGLVLVFWLLRWAQATSDLWIGREVVRASRPGLASVFLFVLAVLSAAIYVRSGAVSTIFGYP